LFDVDADLDPKQDKLENMPKIKKAKKGKDTDFNFVGDDINKDEDSEDSDSEEEDLNYIEMVRVALKMTRAQLGIIDENGLLYRQIKDIFLIFCGDYGGTDELIDLEDLSSPASDLS